MFSCPRCSIRLDRHREGPLVFWRCKQCDGRTATVGLLRRVAPRQTVGELWRVATIGKRPGVRCPSCEKPMVEVPVPVESGTEHVDVCRSCHFVWFDAREFESLPKRERKPHEVSPEERLTPENRREVGLAKARMLAETSRVEADAQPGPEPGWQWLPGLLGMPVQDQSSGLTRKPLVTWVLLVAICGVSVLAFFDLEHAVRAYGLIPDQWARKLGLTLLTSFLLHGGVLHLIGNAYFLLVFGSDVEDFLGHGRFLLLVLIATLFGDFLHIALVPDGSVPCVGASGGISGVIAFYALRFPRARLWVFIRVTWLRLPALALFFLWLGIQLLYLFSQLEGEGDVSALAHLGGVFAGFVWWLAFRERV